MQVHVAVLGATGATGRLLVEELVRRGHEVAALTRAAPAADRRDVQRVVEG
jgi:uncharacterized protein YbjT (DUF2867 family)